MPPGTHRLCCPLPKKDLMDANPSLASGTAPDPQPLWDQVVLRLISRFGISSGEQ